jgi:hypothetical protein
MANETGAPNPLLMEEIPQTLEQLMECIGTLFHCMTGPPRAYFEIPVQMRHRDDGPEYPEPERLVYVTLGYLTNQPRYASVEARLVMRMLEPFINARKQLEAKGLAESALLFWRRAPKIEESLTSDRIQTTRLTCRVMIPGAGMEMYLIPDGQLIHRI